ncbi:unnamed protein product [Mesocestoides corti]|uniref:Amino acid transporter n=1 Tax=Mesocestoides corti TaxID=53468 RepID=A0A0R3UHI7_MESCO|nr:unnamed protein product [Mesocestoides corti]
MADSDKSTIDVSLHGEKEKRGFVLFLRENLFVLLILVGVAVGFGIGFGGKYLPNPETATEYEIDNSTGIPVKVRKQVFNHATNMIGVLYTCIFFGLAARVAGERGLQFLNFFRSLADVVLVLIRWFLLLTPVGVCFMIAGSVVKIDNISHTFAELGFFVVTVLAGSLIDIVLSFAIFVVITRRNPFSFFKHTIKASLVAFATTSPIVSIPEMYEGCDRYGIDTKISRIACPLASALKADGPAIFISTAAMFVAQMSLGSVSVGAIAVIWCVPHSMITV